MPAPWWDRRRPRRGSPDRRVPRGVPGPRSAKTSTCQPAATSASRLAPDPRILLEEAVGDDRDRGGGGRGVRGSGPSCRRPPAAGTRGGTETRRVLDRWTSHVYSRARPPGVPAQSGRDRPARRRQQFADRRGDRRRPVDVDAAPDLERGDEPAVGGRPRRRHRHGRLEVLEELVREVQPLVQRPRRLPDIADVGVDRASGARRRDRVDAPTIRPSRAVDACRRSQGAQSPIADEDGGTSRSRERPVRRAPRPAPRSRGRR